MGTSNREETLTLKNIQYFKALLASESFLLRARRFEKEPKPEDAALKLMAAADKTLMEWLPTNSRACLAFSVRGQQQLDWEKYLSAQFTYLPDVDLEQARKNFKEAVNEMKDKGVTLNDLLVQLFCDHAPGFNLGEWPFGLELEYMLRGDACEGARLSLWQLPADTSLSFRGLRPSIFALDLLNSKQRQVREWGRNHFDTYWTITNRIRKLVDGRFLYIFPYVGADRLMPQQAKDDFPGFCGSLAFYTSVQLSESSLALLALNALAGNMFSLVFELQKQLDVKRLTHAETQASLLPKWAHNMRGPTGILKSYVSGLGRVLENDGVVLGRRVESARERVKWVEPLAAEIDDNCELLKTLGVYMKHPGYVSKFFDRDKHDGSGSQYDDVSFMSEVVEKCLFSTSERALVDSRAKAGGIRRKCFRYSIPNLPKNMKLGDKLSIPLVDIRPQLDAGVLSIDGLLEDEHIHSLVTNASGIEPSVFASLCLPSGVDTKLNYLHNDPADVYTKFRVLFGGSSSQIELTIDFDPADVARCKLPPLWETRPGEGRGEDVHAVFVQAYRFVISELIWNALVHSKPTPGGKAIIKIALSCVPQPGGDALPAGVSALRCNISNTAAVKHDGTEATGEGSTGQGREFMKNIISAMQGKYVPTEDGAWYSVSVLMPCSHIAIPKDKRLRMTI